MLEILPGGVEDREELINTVCNEAAEFLAEVLLSMDHLQFLLHSRQLTREQYETLKEEVLQ